MSFTNLYGADLSEVANITGANITGAMLPDGTIRE
ncbi:MAG TPA: hypothetical protein VGD99_06030 [Anaerolineae bacterium]